MKKAKGGRLAVMHNRKPVALIVGVEDFDREQIELGSSDKYWRLIEERHKQKTITRADLENRLESSSRDRHG